MQHATNYKAKCVHPHTVIETEAFLYLPGMGSSNIK